MKRGLTYPGLLFSLLLFLTACSSQETVVSRASSDIGAAVTATASTRLGTQWGEGIDSQVRTESRQRLSASPVDVMMLYYAAGNLPGRAVNDIMLDNGRIGVSVLNDSGRKMSISRDGDRHFLSGRDGERYILRYTNYSNASYEIVATVDGLDVLNGSAGSWNNRGYILDPYQSLTIEGFRKSRDEVAAFRFSSVQDSYAANTAQGSPANTGVIGTAVFPLQVPGYRSRPYTSPNAPQAFPGNPSGQGYAPPPRYRD